MQSSKEGPIVDSTLATTDLLGVAAVIAALGSSFAAVMGALNRGTTKAVEHKIEVPGNTKTLGEMAAETHHATSAVDEKLTAHLVRTESTYRAFIDGQAQGQELGREFLEYLRARDNRPEQKGAGT